MHNATTKTNPPSILARRFMCDDVELCRSDDGYLIVSFSFWQKVKTDTFVGRRCHRPFLETVQEKIQCPQLH